MNYFYDTEFKEDSKTIDLISIGVVAEDGREFYAVSNEFDTCAVAGDKWLMDNVMSSIEHESFMISNAEGFPVICDFRVTDKHAADRQTIANLLELFLSKDGHPELWAWYGAYDHVALAQLWGRMLDLPKTIPMYTHDLKTLVKLAGNVRTPPQPEGNHNALADARHNVVRYNFLMELLSGKAED